MRVALEPRSWIDAYGKALQFAARAHGEQKTPKGLPYVVHVTTVAAEALAAAAVEGQDAALVAACALLHDVVEDTATTVTEIEAAFGPIVAAGVSALTKDSKLPKDRKMADSLERILRQPREVAVVKLADRIANMAPPPAHWTPEKIESYRAEARQILAALGGASPQLAQRLKARIEAYPG